jgi:glycogen debranching enzyme
MRVIHLLKDKQIEKGVNNGSFLLTNKNQGFAWIDVSQHPHPVSRYNGVFFCDNNKIFRVIESIESENEIKEVKNKFWCAEVFKEGEETRFFMPDNLNSFVIQSNVSKNIFLDFKEAYENDYSQYETEEQKGKIIVKISYKGEVYYLVIRYNGKIDMKKQTINRHYPYDEKRSSYPIYRDVLLLGNINSEKIVFSFYSDKEKAIKESDKVFNELKEIEQEKMERINKDVKDISSEKVNLAYNSCRIMLDNLCSQKGIFAGLPWFFQYWARDELISLKGLREVKKQKAKEILEKWLNYFQEYKDFKILSKETINGEKVGTSIDAVGWLFKRLELFPNLIQGKKGILKEFFSKLDDNFIETKNDTWMDSIERKNAIEIQAMKLYLLKKAYEITNEKEYKEKENELSRKVRQEYCNGEVLFDSIDKKIRPNIFIAYYFYPELLERQEWEKCFENSLKELWCEWGGLSTVSRNDEVFAPNYTGEIPGSYHNGDSWFWVNNLVGWVLADLNKDKFYQYIREILNSSTDEILFYEAFGNHSELSSASELEGQGCVCQAFSAAFFIEFIGKLKEL